MAKIILNDEAELDGKLTFETSYDIANSPIIDIDGVLVASNNFYLERIDKLESEKYVLDGIAVYKEQYSSEEDLIAYYFKSKTFYIKDNAIKKKRLKKLT